MAEMFKPNQQLQIVQEEKVVELPQKQEESEISGLEELLSDWVNLSVTFQKKMHFFLQSNLGFWVPFWMGLYNYLNETQILQAQAHIPQKKTLPQERKQKVCQEATEVGIHLPPQKVHESVRNGGSG